MNHSHSISKDGFSLRPLSKDDLDLLVEWRNQEEIRTKFLDSGLINSRGQLFWYEKYLSRPNDIMFIIEADLDFKGPVGTIALYNIDTLESNAEFGRLMIGDIRANGKGLGLRATKALCQFGFDVLGLQKVHLEVFADNSKAKRIYDSCGFIVVGESLNGVRVLQEMVLSAKDFIA